MTQALTIEVTGTELRAGDYIQGEGVVRSARRAVRGKYILVIIERTERPERNPYSMIFLPDQKVEIRLEDNGR